MTAPTEADYYADCPGSFVKIHKKCRRVFPRHLGGIKLDVGKVDGDGSRIQFYYSKFGPDVGGVVDYKFDETTRFRYLTFPIGAAEHINRVQLETRRQRSVYGVEVGPTLNFHYLRRVKDVARLADIPGFHWAKKHLQSSDAQLDVGGQFMVHWNNFMPFVGARFSTTNYTAAGVFGLGAFMASIWCSAEGAQFGISHEYFAKGMSVTTFGCKKEYKKWGFTHSVACSTNQTLRIECEQKLPTSLPMKLVLSYAVQMELQQDRLGVGLIIN